MSLLVAPMLMTLMQLQLPTTVASVQQELRLRVQAQAQGRWKLKRQMTAAALLSWRGFQPARGQPSAALSTRMQGLAAAA